MAKPVYDGRPGTEIYCTTFCNFGHYVRTGRPVAHECRIIPPAALRAEMDGDFEKAMRIMQTNKTCIVRGRRRK